MRLLLKLLLIGLGFLLVTAMVGCGGKESGKENPKKAWIPVPVPLASKALFAVRVRGLA